MQDLTAHRYQFIITPLDIMSNSKEKNESLSPHQFKQPVCTVTNSYAVNHHIKYKSVVIKLGQSVARSNGLNIPMRIETEVIYSKMKNKYSSAKGIIKIYDVFIDDNEVISCVGTFQAEGILDMGPGKHIITKSIGATLIKFQVQAIQVHQNQVKNQKYPYIKDLEQKPYKVQRIILDENSQIQSKISIEDTHLNIQKSHSENFHSNAMIDFTQTRPLQIESRQIIITQIPPTLTTNLQMSLDLQENDLSHSLSNTISNVKTIQIESPEKQGDKLDFENQQKKKKVQGSNLRGFNAMSHDLNWQKFEPNDFIDLKSAINFGNSANTNSGISVTGSKLSAKANNLKKFNQQSSSTINRNYHKNLNINLNSETYSQPPSYKNPNSPQSPFSPYTPLSFHSPTNKKQKFDFQIALPKISKLSSLQNTDKQFIEENQILGDDVILQLQSNKSKKGSQEELSAQSHEFQKVNLNFKNMITQSINLQNSNGKSINSNGEESINNSNKNPELNKINLSQKEAIQKPLSLPNPFTKNFSQTCLIQNQIPDLSMSVASNATSMISNPELFNQYQRKQLQTLGQQLIEQRHKNIEYEERIQKLHLKTVTLRQKYLGLMQQWQQWCMYSNKFIDNLHKDELGCYILQLSKNNQKLSLKYKTTVDSQNDFINFLRLTIKNSLSNSTCAQVHKSNDKKLKTLRTQMSQFNTNYSQGFKERIPTEYQNMENGRSQFDKVIQKIQETYTTNNKLKKQNKQLLTKMETLSIKIQRLENALAQNRQKQTKLSEQNYELKREKEYLETQINSLLGVNHYLKEKDEQMENVITLRENTIQNMKKILEKNNEEMDLLQEEYMGFKKKYENKDLILEEMKEQLADKDDLIQVYKELYGEVNRYYKIRDQYCIEQEQEQQIKEINMKKSYMKQKNSKQIDQIKSQDEKSMRKSQKNNMEQEIKQIILNVPFINSIENISQMNKVNSYSVYSSFDERDRQRKTSLQQSAIREQVKNIEKLKSNEKENKQFYETMQINKNKQLLASIITGNERIQKLKQDDIRVIRKQITKVINKIEIQAKIISGSGGLFLSLT